MGGVVCVVACMSLSQNTHMDSKPNLVGNSASGWRGRTCLVKQRL